MNTIYRLGQQLIIVKFLMQQYFLTFLERKTNQSNQLKNKKRCCPATLSSTILHSMTKCTILRPLQISVESCVQFTFINSHAIIDSSMLKLKISTSSYFIILLLANFISSITLAVLAPFFPPFAKSKGIEDDVVGLIFSAHPLGATMAAYLTGKRLTQTNRQRYMSSGLLVQAVAMFCFSTLKFFESRSDTITIAIVARLLNGVGSAMFFTPFYAILPLLFENQIEQKLAIAAFINSLGYITGPVFGSLLYSIGGFVGPFAGFGMISILTGLIIKGAERAHSPEIQSIKEPITKAETSRIGIFQSLFKYEVFILCKVTFICNLLPTYYTPIIANYFQERFGIPPKSVGYYMIGGSVGYALAAFIIFYYPLNQARKSSYLLLGLLTSGWAQFFYGPEPLLHIDPDWKITVAAQTLCGFTILFPYVLLLPYLSQYLQYYFNTAEDSTRIASALFNVWAGLGELAGPLASGFLVKQFGFQRAASSMGIFIIAVCLLSLLMVYQDRRRSQNHYPVMELKQIEEKL